MRRLLFVFLDGVGVGDASKNNPFFIAQTRYLPFFSGGMVLPDGTPVKAIDPILGVDGLPQSASGQATLFTGENIPLISGHKGSHPNKFMRKIIKEKNILLQLNRKKHKATFINVYPFYSKYFTNRHVKILDDGSFEFSSEFPYPFKKTISVTTCMLIANGMQPFDERALLGETAIYQDFSNRLITQRIKKLLQGHDKNGIIKTVDVPKFSAEKAGKILYRAYQKNHFTLYEYFQTDIFAHRHKFEERVSLIQNLDRFVKTLLLSMDRCTDTILITSDHGNMEDGSTFNHTQNPVPLLVWGKDSHILRDHIISIADVTPAILKFFDD